MHRHDDQWEAVGERAHRGGVATVTDDESDAAHDFIVRQVSVHVGVGRRSELTGIDGLACRDDHSDWLVRQCVEDVL